MKQLFFIFFLFLIHQSTRASDPRIDSMQHILLSQEFGSQEHIRTLNEIAKVYWIISPDSSELYSGKALEYAIEQQDTLSMAESSRMLGVSQWVRGNHEEALKYLFDSRKWYEHERDTLGYANAVMNIGLIYRDQQDYTRAYPNFFLSYGIFKQLGLKDRLVNTANHLGLCYIKTKEPRQAEYYFLEALEISQEINYPYGTATAYYNLGELTSQDSSWNESVTLLSKALDIQQEIGDFEGAARTNHMIGRVHAWMNKLDLSISYLYEAEKLARQVSSKMTLCEVYRTMTCVLEQKGDFEGALVFFKQHHTLQDSLFNARKTQEIARMEHRLSAEKSEQEAIVTGHRIALLEERNANQNAWFWALLIGFSVIAVLVIKYVQIFRRYNERKRILAENRKKLADAQLENARLKELEILEELETKEKKLASYSLNFIQKGEVMENVRNSLKELEKEGDPQNNRKVDQIRKKLRSTYQLDRSWDNFRLTFENIHSGFFSSVIEYCPKVTQNELKLCALIKLQLNLKESASILGISPESVKTARYRLRKKLQIPEEISLHQFMERMNEKSRAA